METLSTSLAGPLWGESTGPRCIPLTKGQWCGVLMFPLMSAWTNCWTNSEEACELKCLYFYVHAMFVVFVKEVSYAILRENKIKWKSGVCGNSGAIMYVAAHFNMCGIYNIYFLQLLLEVSKSKDGLLAIWLIYFPALLTLRTHSQWNLVHAATVVYWGMCKILVRFIYLNLIISGSVLGISVLACP